MGGGNGGLLMSVGLSSVGYMVCLILCPRRRPPFSRYTLPQRSLQGCRSLGFTSRMFSLSLDLCPSVAIVDVSANLHC